MKIKEKIEELRKEYQFKIQGLFRSVCIETIAYCNRNCEFCPNNDRYPNRKQGMMPTELWKKIINQLSAIDYHGRISPHLFGEVLLDKRIISHIAYAREKCPKSELLIMSNGDFLTEQLLKELIEAGLDSILITNYDDIEKTDLNYITNKYRGYVILRNFSDVEKINRAGILDNVGKPINNILPCFRPLNQLVINWQGDVILCCNDYYEKHIFGNANDENILQIWRSKKMKRFQNILSQEGGRLKIDICKECDNK